MIIFENQTVGYLNNNDFAREYTTLNVIEAVLSLIKSLV